MKRASVLLAAFFFSFACVTIFSCGAEENNLATDLSGNWIILYPDHQLVSVRQREVYGRYQDSVVSLYGLKLITLGADGSFREMDSLHRPPGRWLLTPDSLLKIREAGKGFNPFNTECRSLRNDELQLTQYLPLENERLKLVWHLKKIAADSAAARLFSDAGNAWRKKPALPETKAAMQKRLVSMLNYYADYFALVEKEASYFSPARVPLPFRYYQHAVGLKEMPASFIALFCNPQQAAEAYRLLESGLAGLKGRYPYAENFVREYSLFLKKLANWLSYDLPKP